MSKSRAGKVGCGAFTLATQSGLALRLAAMSLEIQAGYGVLIQPMRTLLRSNAAEILDAVDPQWSTQAL